MEIQTNKQTNKQSCMHACIHTYIHKYQTIPLVQYHIKSHHQNMNPTGPIATPIWTATTSAPEDGIPRDGRQPRALLAKWSE